MRVMNYLHEHEYRRSRICLAWFRGLVPLNCVKHSLVQFLRNNTGLSKYHGFMLIPPPMTNPRLFCVHVNNSQYAWVYVLLNTRYLVSWYISSVRNFHWTHRIWRYNNYPKLRGQRINYIVFISIISWRKRTDWVQAPSPDQHSVLLIPINISYNYAHRELFTSTANSMVQHFVLGLAEIIRSSTVGDWWGKTSLFVLLEVSKTSWFS